MSALEGIRHYRVYSLVFGTVILQAILFSIATFSSPYSFSSNSVSLSLPTTTQSAAPVQANNQQHTLQESPAIIQDTSLTAEIPTNEIEAGEVIGQTEVEETAAMEQLALQLQEETSPEQALLEEQPKTAETFYTVRSGDTLTSIWTNNGGTYIKALEAAKSFEHAGVKLSTIRAGERIKIITDGSEITFFEKNLPQGKRITLRLSPEGTYTHEIFTPTISTLKKTASGAISSSLAESASIHEIPYAVVDEFVDLFSGRVEFNRDLQRGDSFQVVYEERINDEGTLLDPGPIQVASLMNEGELLVAVRHVGSDGEARYYDESGESIGNYFLRYPVRFSRISSVFSKSRFHPILKRRKAHNGVDFAAPTGTPVRTVADGVVITAGYNRASGNMVKIRHTKKYSTAYLHLSRISKGLRKGARVKRGEVIGAVGSTGYSTGPHLHYSLYENGRYVDPMKTKLPKMPDHITPIPKDVLQATLAQVRGSHEQAQMAYEANLAKHKA